MSDRLHAALEPLVRIAGVRGAMIVTRVDGLVVAESIMEDVESAALSALATSLARRLEAAAGAAGGGAAQFLIVQAALGAVLMSPLGPEMLLVVIAERGVNVGRARLEMGRVAEGLG